MQVHMGLSHWLKTTKNSWCKDRNGLMPNWIVWDKEQEGFDTNWRVLHIPPAPKDVFADLALFTHALH